MSELDKHLGYVTERLEDMMQVAGAADHALSLIALNMNLVRQPVRDDSDQEEFLLHAGAWGILLRQAYLEQQSFNRLTGIRVQNNARTSFHTEASTIIDTFTTETSYEAYSRMNLAPYYYHQVAATALASARARTISAPATAPHAHEQHTAHQADIHPFHQPAK